MKPCSAVVGTRKLRQKVTTRKVVHLNHQNVFLPSGDVAKTTSLVIFLLFAFNFLLDEFQKPKAHAKKAANQINQRRPKMKNRLRLQNHLQLKTAKTALTGVVLTASKPKDRSIKAVTCHALIRPTAVVRTRKHQPTATEAKAVVLVHRSAVVLMTSRQLGDLMEMVVPVNFYLTDVVLMVLQQLKVFS